MDPLSITASVLALATAAASISTAISRLRHFGEVPQKIVVLKNEIVDLEIVLRHIEQALKQNLLAPISIRGSLNDVLQRAKGHLSDIVKALERVAEACENSRVKVITKSTIWYKEKEVFQTFRSDVVSVKASLVLILTTSNSMDLQQVILELQSVSIESDKSGQATQILSQGLNNQHVALRTRMDEHHTALRDRIESLAQTLSSRPLDSADAGKLNELATLSREKGDTVRVVASHRWPCRNYCPCACHVRRQLRVASPGMMEGVLGRMFVGFAGLPMQRETCDFRGCRDKQRATATVEYWFPSWFVSMNVKLHLTYQPRAGPELQLSTARRVPDSAQSITFAMRGDIEGLKYLFSEGLAGPRDVSNSRGYTLLRWALYGGMHNHQTVQFLIRAGALVDEESYSNVWDFVFRGKCDEAQQGALRCITEGGESDWIDDQNFPLVHRIIFGLSTKLLASELEENPRAICLTDTQNRTALDWATARCQLDDIALLVASGADVNNMDVTGRTPVLHAVDSHDADTLHAILKAGGNPNPQYPQGMFRSSPLTAAGFAGMTTLLKLLLEFEADPNACNPEGLTALHSVARTHNTECAELLLEYAADLNAMSGQGLTPFTVAIIHNNHRVLRLFVNRCHEYMTTISLSGPEILPIISEHADEETMHILASLHPLRISYDVSWVSLNKNREVLEKRRDFDEKLGAAFEELVAVIRAELEETRSVDSLLESGFFMSARSSFHSELADANIALSFADAMPSSSEGSEEEWEEPREQPGSPISPNSTQAPSATFRPRPHPLLPSSPGLSPLLNSPSPLRRQLPR